MKKYAKCTVSVSITYLSGMIWNETYVRRPFENFVDSPYYSELELLEVQWLPLFRSASLGKRCIYTTLHPLVENCDWF